MSTSSFHAWRRAPRVSTRRARENPMRLAARHRVRCRIEALEERVVLSNLLVNTTQDVIDSTDTFLSLREALTEASTLSGPDTITFDPTLFASVARTITLNPALGQLTVNSDVSIVGPTVGVTITRGTAAGTPAFRLFKVESGSTASFANLTLTRGTDQAGDARGGGMLVDHANVSLTNCTFRANRITIPYGFGGGLYNDGGVVDIALSSFVDNHVTRAGAAIESTNGVLTLTDSRIANNSVSTLVSHGAWAGAIAIVGGSATLSGTLIERNTGLYAAGLYSNGVTTLTDCTVQLNQASIQWGGIENWGDLTLTRCLIATNRAEFYAGVGNNNTLSMKNSTVTGNVATHYDGGGIHNADGATANIHACSIIGNSAHRAGGGIFATAGGTVVMSNTIVASNTASNGRDVSGEFLSLGYNLIGVVDGSTGFDESDDLLGTAAAPLTPLLAPLGNYGGPTQTMALLPGSPAIDAGSAVAGVTTDQRGIPRPQGIAPDIGAFELEPELPGLVVTTTADAIDNTDFQTSLREAIAYAATLPGADTITFDPTVFGSVAQTIVLDPARGQLTLNSDVSIVGPAIGVTVRRDLFANAFFRIFAVPAGVTAALENLTIQGGETEGVAGGGVENRGRLTMTRCTVRNNDAGVYDEDPNKFGGGIYTVGPALTLNFCTLTGNHAENGGGLFVNAGIATLNDTTITGNVASYGGGIYNVPGATLIMNRCSVGSNQGEFEAGWLYNRGTSVVDASQFSSSVESHSGRDGIVNTGSLTLTKSNISGTSAGIQLVSTGTLEVNEGRFLGSTTYWSIVSIERGSATLVDTTFANNLGNCLYNGAATTIRGSTFSKNRTDFPDEGTITNFGTLTLVNSTLAGNRAGSAGGAIYNGGTLTVLSSTISNNTAPESGGGIFNSPSRTARIESSIIAGNSAPTGRDVSGAFVSLGYNLIGVVDGSTGFDALDDLLGTAAAPLNPLLAPLGNYGGPTQTMALLPGSPAIDAGSAVAGVTTDQRGIARPQGAAPDIGAYESRGFTLSIVQGNNQQANVGTEFAQALVVRVQAIHSAEPVAGGHVAFSAPTTGASATLSNTDVAIAADGLATTVATANMIAGDYLVRAISRGTVPQGVNLALANKDEASIPQVLRFSVLWGTKRKFNLPTAYRVLPWMRINRIQIQFDQAITGVQLREFQFKGLNRGDYLTGSSFNLDKTGKVVTIRLIKRQTSGTAEWDALAPTWGDRLTFRFGTFQRTFSLLPGDFNRDGVVNQLDLDGVRNQALGLTAPTLFADMNGDGVVDMNDHNVVQNRLGWRLPTL